MLKVVKHIDWDLKVISFIYPQIEHFIFALNWLILFWFSYHYILFQCWPYNHRYLKVREYENISNFFLKIPLGLKSSHDHKQEQKQHFLLKKYVKRKNAAYYDLDLD